MQKGQDRLEKLTNKEKKQKEVGNEFLLILAAYADVVVVVAEKLLFDLFVVVHLIDE
jgi:hypothetical protein